MNSRLKSGFSLVEVMMAAGILAVGFMLIMTLWPAGMKLTAISTERVVGKVVADEAFAKIRLYGLNSTGTAVYSGEILSDPVYLAMYRKYFDSTAVDLADVADWDALYAKAAEVLLDERMYPSADVGEFDQKYCWSALIRHITGRRYQVTVFVSRLTNVGGWYPAYDSLNDEWSMEQLPVPVPVPMTWVADASTGLVSEIEIDDTEAERYVNSRVTVVDGREGKLLRILERDGLKLILADDVDENLLGNEFWTLPPTCKSYDSSAMTEPPEVGSRCPCISVFQRVIEF